MARTITDDLDKFIGTLALLFRSEGKSHEVAVLAHAKAQANRTGYDGRAGGVVLYTICLELPTAIYHLVAQSKEALEQAFRQRMESLLGGYPKTWIDRFLLLPMIETQVGWREGAKLWAAAAGISNQGRAHSNNSAALVCDGLFFRSQPEIYLYQALKSYAVTFSPLPVFLRGGEDFRRIEPDFVLFKDGVLLHVEVDGKSTHSESPVEAHSRTTILLHEGAYVERIAASECDSPDKAAHMCKRLLGVMKKHYDNR